MRSVLALLTVAFYPYTTAVHAQAARTAIPAPQAPAPVADIVQGVAACVSAVRAPGSRVKTLLDRQWQSVRVDKPSDILGLGDIAMHYHARAGSPVEIMVTVGGRLDGACQVESGLPKGVTYAQLDAAITLELDRLPETQRGYQMWFLGDVRLALMQTGSTSARSVRITILPERKL